MSMENEITSGMESPKINQTNQTINTIPMKQKRTDVLKRRELKKLYYSLFLFFF